MFTRWRDITEKLLPRVAKFFLQTQICERSKKQEKPFAGKYALALGCLVDLLEPRFKSVLIFGGTGGGVDFQGIDFHLPGRPVSTT